MKVSLRGHATTVVVVAGATCLAAALGYAAGSRTGRRDTSPTDTGSQAASERAQEPKLLDSPWRVEGVTVEFQQRAAKVSDPQLDYVLRCIRESFLEALESGSLSAKEYNYGLAGEALVTCVGGLESGYLQQLSRDTQANPSADTAHSNPRPPSSATCVQPARLWCLAEQKREGNRELAVNAQIDSLTGTRYPGQVHVTSAFNFTECQNHLQRMCQRGRARFKQRRVTFADGTVDDGMDSWCVDIDGLDEWKCH